jgi:hypothetical protein
MENFNKKARVPMQPTFGNWKSDRLKSDPT